MINSHISCGALQHLNNFQSYSIVTDNNVITHPHNHYIYVYKANF